MRAGVYKHHKGGLYQVFGLGQHTETGEIGVIYIPLTGAGQPGPRIRFRPRDGDDGWAMPVFGDGSAGRPLDAIERYVYVGDEIPQADRDEYNKKMT